MSSTSIATNGMSGSAVLVVCWILSSHYGVVFPDYITSALVMLTVGASHGVMQLLTRKPVVVAAPVP